MGGWGGEMEADIQSLVRIEMNRAFLSPGKHTEPIYDTYITYI